MIDLKPNVQLAPLLDIALRELKMGVFAKEEVELRAMKSPLTRIIEELSTRELVQEP